jgi:hypothetical protein
MNFVGFDSIMMKRGSPPPITNPLGSPDESGAGINAKPRVVFQALLGVSITTENYQGFAEEYERSLSEALVKRNLPRQKIIYKAAQLAKLSPENELDIIADMLESLNPFISRIDIYSTHLELMKSVSLYGSARGSKLHPVEFLNKIENSYPQICGWKYTTLANMRDCTMQFDHFEGNVSPSWKEMKTKGKIEIYYNGAEVNPLISLVDMTLRLIDKYQHGIISAKSMTQTLKDHAFLVSPKARFYDITSIDDLKSITPNLPVDMDTKPFIKHPVFHIVWNPREPRKFAKPSFELAPLYNSIMKRAAKEGGCVKFLEQGKDELFWKEEDYLIPWGDVDIELVEQLGKMYPNLPKILSSEDLMKG